MPRSPTNFVPCPEEVVERTGTDVTDPLSCAGHTCPAVGQSRRASTDRGSHHCVDGDLLLRYDEHRFGAGPLGADQERARVLLEGLRVGHERSASKIWLAMADAQRLRSSPTAR